jgi:starch synthase
MSPTLTPAYDNKIARKYSARTIEHKAANKAALQDLLGWPEEPKQPIVCLSTGMTDELGGPLLEQVINGILELPVALVIRGRGSKKYGKLFTQLQKRSPHRIAILGDDEENLRTMLAGSDIALFCSAKSGDDIQLALRYGVIPVALPTDTLDDYNPVQETGNAFVYAEPSPWLCFASLARALETFKFPFDWRTIQRHAMESAGDSGTEESAD